MTKPAFRVEPPGDFDVDVHERVVRALQDSPLHVFALDCLASDPDHPDSASCIALTVTAVTDGERGFLVMCDDFAPPRTDSELTELMDGLCEGAARGEDYVICVANIYRRREGDEGTEGILELTDWSAARSAIESAYERVFHGKDAIDHAVFFESPAPLGLKFDDETGRRSFVRELDQVIPLEREGIAGSR